MVCKVCVFVCAVFFGQFRYFRPPQILIGLDKIALVNYLIFGILVLEFKVSTQNPQKIRSHTCKLDYTEYNYLHTCI